MKPAAKRGGRKRKTMVIRVNSDKTLEVFENPCGFALWITVRGRSCTFVDLSASQARRVAGAMGGGR